MRSSYYSAGYTDSGVAVPEGSIGFAFLDVGTDGSDTGGRDSTQPRLAQRGRDDIRSKPD
ncbi:hypothetical protein AWENTII_010047 [Aspergillus wentii]